MKPIEQILLVLKRLLDTKQGLLVILLLAFVLTLPSVQVGLQMDDYLIEDKLLKDNGEPRSTPPIFSLFTFTPENPEAKQEMLTNGSMSWWNFDTIRLAFLRPLSELTHWLDFYLFNDAVWVMHLHSILWYVLVCFILYLVYRRFMGATWVAGFAALLFAIDNSHAIPVEWLCNRNVLIASVFGALALLLHHRYREKQWVIGLLGAPLCFMLSLGAAEAGVAFFAYLFAYALVLDQGARFQRFLSILPYVFIVMMWGILRVSYDFSAIQAGIYVDPLHSPFEFLMLIAERIPIYLFTQWVEMDGSLFMIIPSLPGLFLWIGMTLFVLSVLFLLRPLFQKDRIALFWFIGMILAIIPVCAVVPGLRNLFIVSIGAMGILSRFIYWKMDRERFVSIPWLWKKGTVILFGILMIFNMLSAPISLALNPFFFKQTNETILTKPVISLSESTELDGKNIIVVNPPYAFVFFYIQAILKSHGITPPESCHALMAESRAFQMDHINNHTVEITVHGFPPHFVEYNPTIGIHAYGSKAIVGNILKTSIFEVVVLEVTDGGYPHKVRFTFEKKLDDPSVLFLTWDGKAYHPFILPGIGSTRVFNPEDI